MMSELQKMDLTDFAEKRHFFTGYFADYARKVLSYSTQELKYKARNKSKSKSKHHEVLTTPTSSIPTPNDLSILNQFEILNVNHPSRLCILMG